MTRMTRLVLFASLWVALAPIIDGSMGYAQVAGASGDTKIDAVFFAQTHVQQPDHPYFKLVGNRAALLKVHVVSPSLSAAPPVSAMLSLNGSQTSLVLRGPAVLPASISIAPGVVEHRFDNCFTVMIPKEWISRGLEVTVAAGDERATFDNLKIGAPSRVHMTMFDIHYFEYEEKDYDPGWREDIEVKWPVAELQVHRVPNVVFEELVVAPRPNGGLPAVRCRNPEDYLKKTGKPFDGEQGAASQWKGALQSAGGQGRLSLFYVNIYNVPAGGQAGGFGGVGGAGRTGLMHHELGHALGLPHWSGVAAYPYKDAMYGIECGGPHVGPTWGFDPRIGLPGSPAGMPRFVSPIVQEHAAQGKPGEWKHDPMQGGMNDADPGLLLRMFSDYSVNRMQAYIENRVAIWDTKLKSYVTWNDEEGKYSNVLENNGVSLPLENNVEVVSVMAAVSAVTPEANLVYPPIGPYTSGLIRLFDPTVADDRARAVEVFSPEGGCDVSLRVVQGGKTKTYMLPIAWRPDMNPIQIGSLQTRAINLPACDGSVTHVELLLTPDADKNGLPEKSEVLDSWAKATGEI